MIQSAVFFAFLAGSVASAINIHQHQLKHLKAIVKLHEGGFPTTVRPNFPPGFVTHPGVVDKKRPILFCDYLDYKCFFNEHSNILWTSKVNNRTQDIIGQDTFSAPLLNTVSIHSTELLHGTKCLFFTTYSNTIHINFAVSFASHLHETITPISGNRHQVKRLSIGVSTDKPYRIIFHVYAFSDVKLKTPSQGIAIIGKIIVVDGPCSKDKETLTCSFDYTLCHWVLHDKKYIWYPLPFGLHHTVPHKIEWGALAAFGGEGNLWSPLVTSITARCFTFVYAKGVAEESYLRVWLLYRIPGVRDARILLYEDRSFNKVVKKLVEINLFIPFHFQIAFEGRSKTVLHGVYILSTKITEELCKGIGLFRDVNKVLISDSFTPVNRVTVPTALP